LAFWHFSEISSIKFAREKCQARSNSFKGKECQNAKPDPNFDPNFFQLFTILPPRFFDILLGKPWVRNCSYNGGKFVSLCLGVRSYAIYHGIMVDLRKPMIGVRLGILAFFRNFLH